VSFQLFQFNRTMWTLGLKIFSLRKNRLANTGSTAGGPELLQLLLRSEFFRDKCDLRHRNKVSPI
jgi:hypothetical protein